MSGMAFRRFGLAQVNVRCLWLEFGCCSLDSGGGAAHPLAGLGCRVAVARADALSRPLVRSRLRPYALMPRSFARNSTGVKYPNAECGRVVWQ